MVRRLELPGRDAVGLRAANPGPFSLSGTNSWVIARNPAWLIDPGPLLDEHVDALCGELARRGGLRGILLTHDHHDHCEAASAIAARFTAPIPVAAARGGGVVRLHDGDRHGPFEVLALPGHAPDHLVFLWQGVAFTGDAVLGEGSVFIAADPGALRRYLDGLERLRGRAPELLAPGHGPIIPHPELKLQEYAEHRNARERALLDALAAGARTIDQLVAGVWSDAPAALRPAVEVTLAAHLDKLEEEGRLPPGVQRPAWPVAWLSHA